MLRFVTLTLIFFSVAACSSPSESEFVSSQANVSRRDESCAAVAGLRAQDAAYNDIDRDTQKLVYARTYAECVAGRIQSGH